MISVFSHFRFNLENPVLCDENLPKLVGMFEMYYARLMGIAHCIVPQLLPLQTDPQSVMIQTPPMELLASIMNPNQQIPLGGNQMPSIVQIIVPAHSLQHVSIVETLNNSEVVTTTSRTTTPESILEDFLNETASTVAPAKTPSTIEPLRSSIAPTHSSTPPFSEADKDDDIDDIQLNEDLDSGDDYQDNEEKIKKQRDRSDFRYVESFESEKSILQKFEPDPNDNETELKNIINENYQQIPSVLPVPKALSSPKDTESLNNEPPEVLNDQSISDSGL